VAKEDTKKKEETFNLRWTAELRDKVKDYAREKGYENVSVLIREAIEEKLNSESEEERLEKMVDKLLQDPERRRNLRLK
jgi:metal-responsive CopG/Arc/MetJ family transcriptional regulator